MFLDQHTLEARIHKINIKMREYHIRIAQFNRLYQEVLQELELTPEQVSQLACENDLSEAEWAQIQADTRNLYLQLEKDLNIGQVAYPSKIPKADPIQSHWIFVR